MPLKDHPGGYSLTGADSPQGRSDKENFPASPTSKNSFYGEVSVGSNQLLSP
jgi:hypothetical protein